MDVERRIAQASRAFGALRKSVLLNCNLKVITKHKVYQACMLSVLIGSECWSPLKKDLKKLDSFYNRCVRLTILGITNKQQWSQRIASLEIACMGDPETATVKVMKCCLEWLGHLVRMPDHHSLKICLFSWLPQPRPRTKVEGHD